MSDEHELAREWSLKKTRTPYGILPAAMETHGDRMAAELNRQKAEIERLKKEKKCAPSSSLD